MAQVLQLSHIDPSTPARLALLLLFSLLLLLFLRKAATTRATQQPSHCPPSPPKLPLIGHLHLMGSKPHVSLRDLSRKYGPDFMLLRLGAVPTLIVASPRAAEAIMRTHDHVFASRPWSKVADIILYGAKNVANYPYGEHWRQAKKIVTTHLLAAKKVQSDRLARQEEVRECMASVPEFRGIKRASPSKLKLLSIPHPGPAGLAGLRSPSPPARCRLPSHRRPALESL